MLSQTRLGGFKILNEAACVSLVCGDGALRGPSACCRALAEGRINLNYLSCATHDQAWGIDVVVSSRDAEETAARIRSCPESLQVQVRRASILSVFPHRSDPAVAGELMNALFRAEVRPEALANSPSAVSVVLSESDVERAAEALFDPFQFSAYRTPSDWRMSLAGKEQLFKEVVASYQEKKPKVYFLEWQENRELFRVRFGRDELPALGTFFLDLARLNHGLGFLTSVPVRNRAGMELLLCLPSSAASTCARMLHTAVPGTDVSHSGPFSSFSMNGPHFGDRHGLASELLAAFDDRGVALFGLSCSIATIAGLVPSGDVPAAMDVIKACFEVPSVIVKS
jgi:aspartokinase